MANAGFNQVLGYLSTAGLLGALKIVGSSDGLSASYAEAVDNLGDIRTHQSYGVTYAPELECVVIADLDLSKYNLGGVRVVSSSLHLLLQSIVVTTRAGTPPRVRFRFVQVPLDYTSKRYYKPWGTVSPRSRAQDVASAWTTTARAAASEITTTFSVDVATATVTGVPVAADVAHGKCESSITLTDYRSGIAVGRSAATWIFSKHPSRVSNAGEYIQRSGAAVTPITGAETTDALDVYDA